MRLTIQRAGLFPLGAPAGSGSGGRPSAPPPAGAPRGRGIEHLKRYVTENRLRPGDKLPSELVLAEELGVNRLTVREALKVMESLGILQIRPRHGIHRIETPPRGVMFVVFGFRP